MTIDDIKEKLNIIKKSLDIIQAIFPIDKLKQEKADLEEQQNAPDFFSDMKKVQQVGKQIASIDRKITQISKLVNDYQSIEFLANECKDDEQSINRGDACTAHVIYEKNMDYIKDGKCEIYE